MATKTTKPAAPANVAAKGKYFNLAGEDISQYITEPKKKGDIRELFGLLKGAKKTKPDGKK